MGNPNTRKQIGVHSGYLIAAIICTIGILVLSILPPQSFRQIGHLPLQNLDKLVHVCMYAVLAFLWFKTLNKGNFSKIQSGLIVLVVSIYGVLMEYAQLLIKGRSYEWEDMLSNTIGAILGIVIASMKRTSAE